MNSFRQKRLNGKIGQRLRFIASAEAAEHPNKFRRRVGSLQVERPRTSPMRLLPLSALHLLAISARAVLATQPACEDRIGVHCAAQLAQRNSTNSRVSMWKGGVTTALARR